MKLLPLVSSFKGFQGQLKHVFDAQYLGKMLGNWEKMSLADWGLATGHVTRVWWPRFVNVGQAWGGGRTSLRCDSGLQIGSLRRKTASIFRAVLDWSGMKRLSPGFCIAHLESSDSGTSASVATSICLQPLSLQKRRSRI